MLIYPINDYGRLLHKLGVPVTHALLPASRPHMFSAPHRALCGHIRPFVESYTSPTGIKVTFTETPGDVDCLECKQHESWGLWELNFTSI